MVSFEYESQRNPINTGSEGYQEKTTPTPPNTMTTITKADLKATVDRINRMTNSPIDMYNRTEDENGKGIYKANIGNYHLSGAYGGYSLHRMDTDGGGITDVLGCGHLAKRDLYDRMQSFIRGLEVIA